MHHTRHPMARRACSLAAILITATAMGVQSAGAVVSPAPSSDEGATKATTTWSDEKTATPGQSVELVDRYSIRDTIGTPFTVLMARATNLVPAGLKISPGSETTLAVKGGASVRCLGTITYDCAMTPLKIKVREGEAFEFTVRYSVGIPITAKAGDEYRTPAAQSRHRAFVRWRAEGAEDGSTATFFDLASDHVRVVERPVPLAHPVVLAGAAVTVGGFLHFARRRRDH